MNTLPPYRVTSQIQRTLLAALALLATASAALAQTLPWRFIAVGDTRGGSSTAPINTATLTELANEIVRQNAQFVVVPGDLVYSGSLSDFQSWKGIMGPVYQAGIGVYPVMGNHDANAVSGWSQVFGPDLPDNGPAGELDRTYAFSLDNTLIVALDTELNLGRVNQAWLDGILAQNTLPHVFVFGHRPAFKANHADCLDDYPTQRDTFWNSLKTAGARAYFCGHDHFYDHLRADDGDGDPLNDVHQLIVGCGGAPFHTTYAYDGVNSPWAPVNLFHEAQYGYTVVEVDGLTVTMTFFHRNETGTYVQTADTWTYTVNTGPTPPAPPTGLSAIAGNTTVTLTWSPSAGAATYNVWRAEGSPSATYGTIASGLTATTCTDRTVLNGTTYYYVVTAVNGTGESEMSAYVGASPQGPPPAPAILAATPGNKRGQIKLSWAASPGASSYMVKRATKSGGPYAVVKAKLPTTSYSDNKLTSGSTYYYVVTAVNGAGESPPSPEASARAK